MSVLSFLGSSQATRALVVVALLTALGSSVFFAHAARANRAAATQWQRTGTGVLGTLTAQTEQLNATTATLNRVSAKLASSESDAKDLERRLADLAHEKADTEDDTAIITDIAREQGDCNDLLAELLRRFAYADYGWIDANVTTVSSTCGAAEADLKDALAGNA